MLSFSGILLLTVRELWAKKVVIGLFVVSSLVLLSVGFALNLDVVEGSLASMRIFGQEQNTGVSLEELVVQVEAVVAGGAYWVGILLALFASAPLFTTLVDEGHIDLLLSKPTARWQLLGGHVLGVWLTMLGLSVYLLGGVWLLMSVKSGVWNLPFLLAILVVVALFAVMYGVVVLVGTWTESTALSLIVTYGLIFVSMVLAGVDQIVPQLSTTSRAVFYALYHVLPNFTEVTQLVSRLARGEAILVWYPFLSSLLFGAACYAVGAWIFQRRDF
jgi:ABC-type transport system involved in multi-copper enzyme maturation permease subunit